MPTDEADLRRLGRAVGHRRDAAREVVAQWQAQAREVRRMHERLFYRPLLAAAARLSTAEARLTPEAARERLAALGFRDPAGALRHIEALTAGVSRRAAIQRTLLPVMLGWFADEADPDAGLLSFRTISESLGTTHWYLKMLRDEGSAAERLAHVLGRSRYAADLLVRAPESVAILGDAGGLSPRPRAALQATMTAATRRKESADDAMTAARVVRRQELFRVAVADLTGLLDLTRRRVRPHRPHRRHAAVRARHRRTAGRGRPRAARHPAARGRHGAAGRRRDGLLQRCRRAVRARARSRQRRGRGAEGRDPRGPGDAPAARRGRPGPAAGPGRRPAAGGQERPAGALAAVLPGLLRALVPRRGSRRPCCAPPRSPATRSWAGSSWPWSTRCGGRRAG